MWWVGGGGWWWWVESEFSDRLWLSFSLALAKPNKINLALTLFILFLYRANISDGLHFCIWAHKETKTLTDFGEKSSLEPK